MEQSGGNISTGAGNGEAFVFDWQPVHQRVNQLIQRDIMQQKQMQDIANKAALELKKAGTAARPEDIPELTQLYNTYRTAGMQLLNPKVAKDPTQKAYWQKMQDESELSYHALANDSKTTGKLLATLPMEYAKAGGNGFKPIDEFGHQLSQAKGLSTRQIKQSGLDNPISYMAPRELYPAKDYQQHVFGGFGTAPGAVVPHKNEKGEVDGQYETHVYGPKNPPHIIFANTVEAMHGNPYTQKSARESYMNDVQSNPQSVEATIKNAADYVKTLPQADQDTCCHTSQITRKVTSYQRT
jgi:hypothetical protein